MLGSQKKELTIIREAYIQLNQYFLGKRKKFELNLAYNGSIFQNKVWQALEKISYGETKSYKEIGEAISCPRSALAVGGACGKNPLPIFLPCHRVIGRNGDLVGYHGGLEIKKYLLAIERKYNV